MIKKIKIELIIIALLLVHIFILGNTDTRVYSLFYEYVDSLNNIYLKKFFINITEIGDSLWFFIISVLGFLIAYFLLGEKVPLKNIIGLIIAFIGIAILSGNPNLEGKLMVDYLSPLLPF